MEQDEKDYSPMQRLKRRLYAMRNGVVADSLRRAGCPRRLIFGVNLPQLNEIAAEFGPSEELAEALRNDTALRESVLLAPMLFPIEKLDRDMARKLCEGVKWAEEADILCFKLLRKADFAAEMAMELCEKDEPLQRYCGLRLWMNIVGRNPSEALKAAEKELSRDDGISTLASMLAEEARFLTEE